MEQLYYEDGTLVQLGDTVMGIPSMLKHPVTGVVVDIGEHGPEYLTIAYAKLCPDGQKCSELWDYVAHANRLNLNAWMGTLVRCPDDKFRPVMLGVAHGLASQFKKLA